MKSLQYFIRILTNCLLLITFGCAVRSNSQTQPAAISSGCLEKPEQSLESQNVKPIVLGDRILTESGIASQSKAIGYSFEGKANQKLTYTTNKNVCIWVFAPDNQLLNTGVLPTTGKYTIQVSAPQGSTTFDLSVGLDVVQATPASAPNSPAVASTPSTATAPTVSPPTNTTAARISRSNFPKSTCGDPLPTNPNDYPVDFYPVYLPDSEANLQLARSRFCQDALLRKRKDSGTRAVQVAAFTSKQRAIEFRDFLNSETSGSSIGPPTTIHNQP